MFVNQYIRLKEKSRLVKESNRVILFIVVSGEKYASMFPVHGLVLSLCNGRNSTTEISEALVEIYEMELLKAQQLISELLVQVADFIECQSEPFAHSTGRYDPADFIYEPENKPWNNKLEVPNTVVWMTTNRCPADCVYCVIPTLKANEIAPYELSTEQAFKFLEECVSLGVKYINLHGGDPFLRKDMIDIIEYLLSNDVFVDVSTKMPLRESLIERLAKAGLDTLQVSIDSHIPHLADAIVRVNNWLPKINQTIELCQKYDLKVRANIVVTAKNIDGITNLLLHLIEDKGIKDIGMSSYLRSEHKHDDSLLISHEQREALVGAVNEIAAQYPDVEIGNIPLHSERDISLSIPGFGACSGGKTALVIGSDGECATCDRTMPYEQARIGNVKESTIKDIWNGDALTYLLNPPQEEYQGTPCYDCGHFDACNVRQRCYYRAQLINGRLYAPDYLCAKLPEPPIEMF
ncbi:radical SAM/SPASM domain-containing protein [Pseudoalteromonas byunsanensis]|uniref:Radical SAM core domain-containing protein n=1 Tax=Pseudoalteromonas byunsanensis TaxID=327939 RepID=A0A1S1N2M5_9GAMM|nr:radical SAM protein [Pseudoalteromonas byunsanensis]OHU95341.1 hypothetical protein BIW53_11550 [Pseudoalteromonas byunsanensis]